MVHSPSVDPHVPSIDGVSAYLPDMDGVLVHSRDNEIPAFRDWAKDNGIPWDTVLPELFNGTTAAVIARIAPRLDAAAEARKIDARQIRSTHGVVALPGARELLTGPYPVAVVTSSSRPVARALMKAAGLPLPEVTVTPEDLTGPGKPEPECYELAAARLRVPPERSVVFEDTPGGARAARLAGCWVVGITTSHPADDLSDAHEHAPTIAAWFSART